MTVACFVPDLMDRSRISAARPDATFVSRLDDLAGTGASVLVVDLSRSDLEAVRDLPGRVVGFAPHVDDALIEAARRAGAEVMPRSRFFASLGSVLGG